jgi:hypothetical protein
VATDVATAYPPQDGSPNLVIARGTVGAQLLSSVVDLATLRETFLPGGSDIGSQILFSPSNRWILLSPARDQTAFTLLDRASGATRPLSFPTYVSNAIWRPGHDEIWSAGSGTYWIAQTDGSVAAHTGNLYLYYPTNASDVVGGFLSPDGRDFFTANNDGLTHDKFPVYVGPADDPGAPPVRLNPAGTGTMAYGPLPDGRLVAQAFYLYSLRSDLIVVDPTATAAPRVIAEGGFVLGLGSGRVLAMHHWATEGDGPGDLSLVDVDSGATTWIGRSIVSPTVFEDPAPGRDALAPGSHVAYVLVNRVASPYDGVWVAALP